MKFPVKKRAFVKEHEALLKRKLRHKERKALLEFMPFVNDSYQSGRKEDIVELERTLDCIRRYSGEDTSAYDFATYWTTTAWQQGYREAQV